MNLNSLKSFARDARKELLKSVSFKIDYVLSENSPARRENPKAIVELENKIIRISKNNVIEEVSYTWFNRFIALQYLDINGFNEVQVILPLKGNTRPEILSNAISGIFNKNLISENTQFVVSSLLDGRSSSSDPDNEAYKLLLVSVCNKLNVMMPYLFERIDDYTELLIPDDLLSNSSIIAKMKEVMNLDNCKDVEVIGWLYQFYISEKKDEIFENLKKNKKVLPENIPAATQLFTPHWIVKYLVENSLGRLWMLNNPNSKLKNHMESYINPEETEFLKICSPEEIKICDPACGSGHLLTYAFDLLYLIYEEEGYEKTVIPSLILKNNLFGIELDKRACDLSAFALTMKAREKNKLFFNSPIQPNICVFENIKFESDELSEYKKIFGIDLLTPTIQNKLKQFENINNFGSLIEPNFKSIKEDIEKYKLNSISKNLFVNLTHKKLLKIIDQANYLDKKYQIVVGNPPYMGKKGMNQKLSNFAKEMFPESRIDLFSMFIERSMSLVCESGYISFLTMQSWMFLGSYSNFRKIIFNKTRLLQIFHTGPGLFPDLGSFNVLTTTFLLKGCKSSKNAECLFIRGNENLKINEKIKSLMNNEKYRKIDLSLFNSIPGKPLVYWLSSNALSCFSKRRLIGEICPPKQGMATSDNSRFVRNWHEVNISNISFNSKNLKNAYNSNCKWFPYNKGGEYRKWYGNNNDVVNWENNGKEIKNLKDKNGKLRSRVQNKDFYFKEGIVYSLFGFENFGVRYKTEGFIFDTSGPSIFAEECEIMLSYLCSNVAFYFLKALAPTVNFTVGDISKLPTPLLSSEDKIKIIRLSNDCVQIVKDNWDSFETSWDFKIPRILTYQANSFSKAVENLINFNSETRNLLKTNEEKINSIFIEDFILDGEVETNVKERDLSIKLSSKKEICLEFISFSVGCMFGRYSLDKEGLVMANQGETLEDYLNRIPQPKFKPDDDNVIPLLESNWFEDDITERFKQFLKVTFGVSKFEDNLSFIENKIGKEIRKYFLNDFYKDHIQRYKKRPIYWMFSSPKGSFNALIYLHRYHKDNVSILLDKYLRELLLKLRAEKNTLEKLEISSKSSSEQKTRAMKKIQKIDSILTELTQWEKETIFPLASQRLEIDLDDGVKNNYSKFGDALKKVSGLN